MIESYFDQLNRRMFHSSASRLAGLYRKYPAHFSTASRSSNALIFASASAFFLRSVSST